ncbi:MAG TPA: ATP-binding protein [Phycisphaerae bacterium]|jgi:Amt family ammonium transporter
MLATAIMEEDQAIALLEKMAAESAPPRRAASAASTDGDARRGWQPDLRYRSLVERLPVVTFMASLDESQQELYISPQIESLLGFTQEEWLNDPFLWFRQLHPDDRERWISEFARTCATGSHFRTEYRLMARDGHIVWIQGECQIIRNDEGQPVFLQGVAFDISHIKRAAEDQEARLAAQAASDAKSQFLARMSHEIRTPLNGVVGMIDLLRTTSMTTAQEHYVDLAREAAGSLLTVINDILDFSKIEAGKVEIEALEFDLHKVVEDITELLGSLAAKKNLALASLIRPDVPRHVIGDPNRIRQVLTNLVNNAMKFTTQGSVTIHVTLEKKEGDRAVMRIQVVDTGIGIPADRLDRLFKSFSQVDSSTTRKYGGTGLGLVISKQLVELMGGQIGIQSQQGRGTTFWFTLNLIAAPANPSRTDAPDEIFRGVRVLAIEPHPTYRKILSQQLDERLSPGSTALNTQEALTAMPNAVAEGKPFSIALVPFGTPEGEHIADTIRRDDRLRDMKLIAVMDIDDRTDAAAITRAGYLAGLHRPITQSHLFDAIASVTFCNIEPGTIPQTAGGTRASLKGLHLLVAEDNEMNQFVTQETLRRAECTCDIVSDGQLAVDAAQRGKYDAILMDCQMPGMDGLEATQNIRRHEAAASSARRIPIIALTAEAIQGDREKCLAAGMDGYVTKPINAEELFAAIRALVGPAAKPDTSPEPPPLTAAHISSENIIRDVPATVVPLPIDVNALLARCMSDATFAIQTLEKFQRRALGDVDLLRQGIAAGDLDRTTRLAHNLKSAAAHTGAGPLRAIAFEMEQAGIRRDLQFLAARLPDLDQEAERCAAFVPHAMKSLRDVSPPSRK